MIVLFFKFNVTFSPIGYIVKVRCCLIGRGCQNARRKLPTFERNTCNPCQLRFVSNANVGKHMLNYLKGSRLMNICCILTESNWVVQKKTGLMILAIMDFLYYICINCPCCIS